MEVCSEKLLAVSAAGPPAAFLPGINISVFFWTCPFWKSVHFLILGDFFRNDSPGQTTLPIRFVSKFCAEPRSQCLKSFHQDSFPSGKTPNIVPWPECRPEFSSASEIEIETESKPQSKSKYGVKIKSKSKSSHA